MRMGNPLDKTEPSREEYLAKHGKGFKHKTPEELAKWRAEYNAKRTSGLNLRSRVPESQANALAFGTLTEGTSPSDRRRNWIDTQQGTMAADTLLDPLGMGSPFGTGGLSTTKTPALTGPAEVKDTESVGWLRKIFEELQRRDVAEYRSRGPIQTGPYSGMQSAPVYRTPQPILRDR
jgi:hypothetical protein